MHVRYQGRLWDAPATDGAQLMNLVGSQCGACRELIDEDDDAVLMGSVFHTECWLRSGLGDVAHLEERCLCFGGGDHDDEGTYREQSKRALDWVVAHGRGRWAA
jgi:hypothetical protein